MPTHPLSRREALAVLALLAGTGSAGRAFPTAGPFRLATFAADVTPPVGHPLLAGLAPPVAAVDDPLEAHGLVLLGGEQPVVLVSIDWLEIRNDAYDAWRIASSRRRQPTPTISMVLSGARKLRPTWLGAARL